MLEDAERLMQQGSFEPALDLIDSQVNQLKKFSEEYILAQILKSRAYYHLSRVDQALYFVDQVIKNEENVAIDDITRLHLYALKSIYQLGLGEYRQGEATLQLVGEQEELLEEQSQFQILSYLYFARGDLAHSNGDINQAIQNYQRSLDYKYHGGENYELNILLYKIGVMYRMQGLLQKSKDFLHESLIVSRELNMTQEHATAATMLGQDAFMTNEFEKAREFIKEGYEEWVHHGSPFGIMWALGELAILDFLEGHTEEAITNYETLLDTAREVLPSFQLSVHLLNIIRFCVHGNDRNRAGKYLEQFRIMVEKENSSNPKIIGRYQLAKVLVNSLSLRVGERLASMKELQELVDHEDLLLRLDGLLNLSRLLLFEYSLTEDELAKHEILDQADKKIGLVLEFIQNKSNVTYELHAALIRSQIEVLREHYDEVVELIDLLKQSQIRIYDEDITAITNEVIKYPNVDDFEFSREFQSIPKIKILLYLLPRIKVPFSELQEGTELSSGNLSGQVEKLEKTGYIFKEKVFVDERPLTMFSISPKGYIELKRYIAGLTDFLNNFM